MDATAAKPTLDAALINNGRVKLTFGPRSGRQIREFLKLGGITLPTFEISGLKRAADMRDTSCDVVATLDKEFPREDFEHKVLPGITALEIAA